MLERSENSTIVRGMVTTLVVRHGTLVMSRVAWKLAPSKVDRSLRGLLFLYHSLWECIQ